jgi:hypothetical protein
MDEGSSSSAPIAGATGADVLSAMWRARGERARVKCLSCQACTLALMVGEGPQYRWSCVGCGWRSLWFFVTGRGGRVRVVGGTTVAFTSSRGQEGS